MVRKSKKRGVRSRRLRSVVIFIFLLLFLYSVSVMIYERETKSIFLEELVARDVGMTTFLPSFVVTDFFVRMLFGFVSGIVSTITLMLSILLGGVGFAYISLDTANLNLLGDSYFQMILIPVLLGGVFGYIVMGVLKRQLKGHLSKRKAESKNTGKSKKYKKVSKVRSKRKSKKRK